MNIKSVPVGRGWVWITEGFSCFKSNPLIWAINFILYMAIMGALSVVPLIGHLGAVVLQPLLIGGLMGACREIEQGQELRIEHLFDGFRKNTNPLVTVGAITVGAYMALGIIVLLVIFASAGLGVLADITNQQTMLANGAAIGILLAVLIGLSLMVPIIMATWFAPALVVFEGLQPVEAMKASFMGCWRNMWPFLWFSVIVLFLSFFALLPAGLGLLVLGPVLIASVYVAYQDIFTP